MVKIVNKDEHAEAQDDVDEVELDEAELVRLQRQFRIMDSERSTCSVESSRMLIKQRDMICRLEREKHGILVNLAIATSVGNECRDAQQEEILERELRIHTMFEESIKKEKGQLSELDVQIFRLEKDVIQLRMQLERDNPHSVQHFRNEERRLETLENRLYEATVKFNRMVQDNKVLRDEIHHLLKERSHFNELYQRLIRRLNKGKKVMMDLIEQGKLAYDQREEAIAKLQSLRERGRQDFIQQSNEMRELQRKLDHETKLQEFLGIKGQRRIMADLEAREVHKKREQRRATERLIQRYQDILDQIRSYSGEEDIDRIISKFVKQEEENFSLFNYVNELNNELQALQGKVENMRSKIDDQRETNREREKQQLETMQSLQEELNEAKEEADTAQARRTTSMHTLDKLLGGIEKLFNAIRCDNSSLIELLGENNHAMTYNVMLYLSLIERRTFELMNIAFLRQAETDPYAAPAEHILHDLHLSPIRPVPVDVMAPTQPCVLCVEQEAFQEMEEGPVAPQTLEEVKAKLADSLSQPGFLDRLHNLSACRLPRARRMMQHRYE